MMEPCWSGRASLMGEKGANPISVNQLNSTMPNQNSNFYSNSFTDLTFLDKCTYILILFIAIGSEELFRSALSVLHGFHDIGPEYKKVMITVLHAVLYSGRYHEIHVALWFFMYYIISLPYPHSPPSGVWHACFTGYAGSGHSCHVGARRRMEASPIG